MSTCRCILILGLCLTATSSGLGAGDDYERRIKPLLSRYCYECHGLKKVKGKVNFVKIKTSQEAVARYELWETAIDLLKHNDMPPEKQARPTEVERAVIFNWYQKTFVDSVKAKPGPFRRRRLSTVEFRNTLNSLLGFKLEINVIEAEQTVTEKSLVIKLMPPDPPGASGFKNDTHGNPLTTTLWDQYTFIIDAALEEFFSVKRRKQLEAYTGPMTGDKLTQGQARKLIVTFIGRAIRRPAEAASLARSLDEIKKSSDLLATLKFELKAVLLSPRFLYRGMLMPTRPGEHPVDNYELAERLSYFIWADMPDVELAAAASGKRGATLSDPKSMQLQIERMLKSPKARALAEVFAVEWLGLKEIERLSKNAPFMVAFKSQPIDFMNHLFTEDRPLIDLIDSKVAFVSPLTAGFYHAEDRRQMTPYRKARGIEIEIVPNQKITLKKTAERGGVLTIPGILMINRGPVLRGTWILERILGDHLPDPPMNVGKVPGNKKGQKLTFRQRFEQHRANPSCAVCHDKIDPLGFSLQTYDNGGRYRAPRPPKPARGQKKGATAKGGQFDTSGKLPSGETFEDFQGLKKILTTTRRKVVLRNIVDRMLSYALARKLRLHDRPTIDRIVDKLDKSNGTYRELIYEIATSLPFTHATVAEKTP